MDGPNTWRIILLGKTGAGKSSLANTIFGEEQFTVKKALNSETKQCQAKTKSINGKIITLINNPGFFDPGRPEEDMKPELVRCITECAPGPHAFLIVLKVERFTEQEQAVITKMCQYFSEDALKYAVVVFTHGDQLPEGMKIEQFVEESEALSDLVKKCGGHCHVIDNRYWKKTQQDEYRSNQFQVAELLNTVEKLVMENNGGCYTNEMLQAVEREIQKEEERIRHSSGNMSQEEIRQQAKINIFNKQRDKMSLTWIQGVVGLAFVAVSAAVLAMVMKVNSETELTEAAVEKLTDVAAEQIHPLVCQPLCPIAKIPEFVITPVKTLKQTLEAVMNRLNGLYESAYNPWNPFE